MAYLTIAGVDVSVTAATPPTLEYTEIGADSRSESADGESSAAVRGWKRRWSVTTFPMLPATAATLRTALAGAPPLSLTGTWAGGTISVIPTIPVETPVATAPFTLRFTFTLDEA